MRRGFRTTATVEPINLPAPGFRARIIFHIPKGVLPKEGLWPCKEVLLLIQKRTSERLGHQRVRTEGPHLDDGVDGAIAGYVDVAMLIGEDQSVTREALEAAVLECMR